MSFNESQVKLNPQLTYHIKTTKDHMAVCRVPQQGSLLATSPAVAGVLIFTYKNTCFKIQKC